MVKPTYEELEQKIEELTAEIVKANELLKNEKDGRKRAEERLEIIESIINRGPAVLFLWGVEPGVWPVKHVSKNIKKILGYSVDDFLSGRISWPGITHPDDVPRLEAENARYFAEGIKEWSQEYRLLTKSGDIRWMKDWNLVLVDSVGESTGLQAIAIDITDLKQVEESLRESEEKYRSLVESTEDSIYLLDRNCTYLFMNKEHLSRLGLTAKKAIGRTYAEFHSEDDTRELVGEVEKIIETGKSLSYEYRSQRDDGYFIRTLSPVKDLDGRTVSIIVVSKDITERKQAEEVLKNSEERYRSTVESSTDAILIMDNERKIVSFNHAFLDLFGYKKDEVEGESIRIIHQSDDSFHSFGQKAYPVIKKVGFFMAEWAFMRKDGTVLPVETVTSVIKAPDGSITGYVAIIRDVTERKQYEEILKQEKERFQILVEELPVGISLIGKDGNYKYLNSRFTEIFGYTLNDIPTGREWFRKAYPDEKYRKEIISTWIGDIKKHTIGKSRPRKYTVTCKDGSEKIIQFNAVTLPNQDQMISCEDFTEIELEERKRKELETQLLQAQKMETIGILAGGVAHDLNNILSGIISYPELLLMDLPEDSPLRKPLLTIKSSGEKAADVVQDLLTMARRGIVITEVVNLNGIISEQLKSPEYEKLKSFHSNVDIKINLEKDLLNIKGSTAHLGKTVMNLTSNAAEAMPDGGKVLISTENLYIDRPIRGYDHVAEGDYVTVTVIDTGIGISKEDMKRIFEPFYTKKVMGRSGSGLGMSVVWGTVKDHNGYIDIESTRGKGTTFTLYFPVIREELAIDKSLLSIEDYMGKGESILIVDDVEEQREIASVMLKKLGYSVKSVSSGEEAIEYMKDNSVDLLILDMIMDPGIDGLDTYKKILELHPKQKAIIASGFSETDRVKKAKKLGAGAYVKKPYVLEKIGLVIKEELEK